jgi:hypothetical protein
MPRVGGSADGSAPAKTPVIMHESPVGEETCMITRAEGADQWAMTASGSVSMVPLRSIRAASTAPVTKITPDQRYTVP